MDAKSYSGVDTGLRLTAAAGQHSHWSAYDIGLEAGRYAELQQLVASDEPLASSISDMRRLAVEIEAMAHGWGWGCADHFLNASAGLDERDIDANPSLAYQRHGLFVDYDDTEYMENSARSTRLLNEASNSDVARSVTEGLYSRIQTAFEAGRDACVDFNGRRDPADGTSVSPTP